MYIYKPFLALWNIPYSLIQCVILSSHRIEFSNKVLFPVFSQQTVQMGTHIKFSAPWVVKVLILQEVFSIKKGLNKKDLFVCVDGLVYVPVNFSVMSGHFLC